MYMHFTKMALRGAQTRSSIKAASLTCSRLSRKDRERLNGGPNAREIRQIANGWSKGGDLDGEI